MSPHYLVKCRISVHLLFVTILLINFLLKQLRCVLKIWMSMDFYCFLNFFTPNLYHFPHKKVGGSEKSQLLGGCDKSRLLGGSEKSRLVWCGSLTSRKRENWVNSYGFSQTLTLCSFYWKIVKILRNLWVVYLKNYFLEFHKVVWWHTSGEVDKFTTIW